MSVGKRVCRALWGGVTIISFVGSVSAQTTVAVSPASKNVLPGGTFTLNVVVNNVAHLHAASTSIAFDHGILQSPAVTYGTFLNGPLGVLQFNHVSTGPTADTILVNQTILGDYGVSGSGTLYTLSFTGIGIGTTPITISSVDLRDTTNGPIAATTQSGSVTLAYPAQTYVDPTYTQGNAGGHEFGYDAYTTLSGAIAAVAAGGTINVAPATYNETFSIAKDVALTPMSGTPIVQNLAINTPAVSLGGNVQVSGVLTLTSGVLTTGTNAIGITNNAAGAVAITSGSVNGQVDRLIAASSTGTYVFTDANTSLTPTGFQGAISVSVRSFPGATPPNINGNPAINRYYTISPSGALTATVRLSYLDSEINGLDETRMSLFRTTGSTWAPVTSSPNPANNYVEATGVSEFSTWTIGDIDNPLPIQLASFTGAVLSNGNVQLTWVTLSELQNYGFYVQRKRPNDQSYQDVSDLIPGHGTTNEPHTYTFTDVAPGSGIWVYRLKQIDLAGPVHYTESIQISVLTAVNEGGQPLTFGLKQNYPNPFNPATTIEFSLPNTGYTTLKVYNLLGKEVASLVDGMVDAGGHAVRWNASSLPSGVYLYKLSSGSSAKTMRLVLMK